MNKNPVSDADILQEKLNEIAFARANALDNFIACYMVETGLKASEIMLVEQHSDDGLRIEWHCEKMP